IDGRTSGDRDRDTPALRMSAGDKRRLSHAAGSLASIFYSFGSPLPLSLSHIPSPRGERTMSNEPPERVRTGTPSRSASGTRSPCPMRCGRSSWPCQTRRPSRANTRVISVLMPNDQSVGYDWAKYRTTARHIQELTGLTFFGGVPAEVAEALRDHRDQVEVRVEPPRGGPGGQQD